MQIMIAVTALLLTATAAVDSLTSPRVGSCRTLPGLLSQSHTLGVDPSSVRLSWTVTSSVRTESQIAAELEVWLAGEKTPSWTSGHKLGSAQSQIVPTALKPDRTYSWRVRVWLSSQPDQPTSWGCGEALFDTAPSNATYPGTAVWIGGGGQLRTTPGGGLHLPNGKIARARLWVTGMGAFYPFVNGKRVGENVMDPPQTVYSKTVLYSSFDILALVRPAAENHFGALLGTYKFGYTDLWCNMTVDGPDGCRALLLKATVTMQDGSQHSIQTGTTGWEARVGPVLWDHFFHGETVDGRIDFDWMGGGDDATKQGQRWSIALRIAPVATAPAGMQVIDSVGRAVALGAIKPSLSPPLRVSDRVPAWKVHAVAANDTGLSYVVDFGRNMAGMMKLSLPTGHGIPRGTELRIGHAEIIEGRGVDIQSICTLCPKCTVCNGHGGGASGPGGGGSCESRGPGAACNTYCRNPAQVPGGSDSHTLRHEPCFPHQSYTPAYPPGAAGPHDTADRYIGDFNNANMTNLYIVRGDPMGEVYTPWFAAAGFRYVQVSGVPAGVVPKSSWFTALRIHSAVAKASSLQLPSTQGSSFQTPNLLQRLHEMTLASQEDNLWSIPTDCPQRERRGWMGDAQASSDESNANFEMLAFYEEYLMKVRDDQLRYDANHDDDKGALADVVPYDGIGGNPGCPVWQVAYIVLAQRLWKHHGEDSLPSLRAHYTGLVELMGWFNSHADADGLLSTACYGDWMGFKPESGNGGSSALTPRGAVSAFYHVLASLHLSQIAGALGHAADAAKWEAQYEKGKTTYHARYYSEEVGGYSPCVDSACHGTSRNGSQTSNSMALVLGAPPDDKTAARVARNLMLDVASFGNKTTTGVVGITWLLPALDAYGYGDTALSMLLNDAYPSLGWMAHQNMTTLCENWACSFHDAGGGSQNHIMLGGFDTWLLSSIGGLDSIVNQSTGGWRHIVARISPAAVTTLKEANYTKATRFGAVHFEWQYDGTNLRSRLSVPVGAQLTLHTPLSLPSGGGVLVSLSERDTLVWSRRAGASALPSGIVEVDLTSAGVQTTLLSGDYELEAVFSGEQS